jgi:hypothetical protein
MKYFLKFYDFLKKGAYWNQLTRILEGLFFFSRILYNQYRIFCILTVQHPDDGHEWPKHFIISVVSAEFASLY